METKDKIPEWVGNLPEGKDNKKPLKIEVNDAGYTEIYGEGINRICCHTYISTNDILISDWIVPPGQSFQPPDIHAGDELYYILEGEAHVFNPETGQLVCAKQGSVVFTPRRSWHQVYNFSDDNVKIIAIITGKIWNPGDLDQVENKNLKSVFFNNVNSESVV